MVAMTKTQLQAEVDRILVNNTTGDVEANEVNELFTDLIDSSDFITADDPEIRSFSIQGQAAFVDAGFQLTGAQTFLYNVTNVAQVDGDLTLKQGVSTLSTTIDPAGPSASVTVNDVTFTAGQVVTFELEGTDLSTNTFSRQFTITARNPEDYIYYGSQVSSDPSTFDFNNETRMAFVAGGQTINVPTFTGNEYLIIAQRGDEPDITSLMIDGIEQIDAFTLTVNAFTVNSIQFDAWTSDHALIGSVISGDRIVIGRS